jgi:hypothetical protein
LGRGQAGRLIHTAAIPQGGEEFFNAGLWVISN